MQKNNPSNSELILRLKTLLAESDQRLSNPQEGTNQEALEETLKILLKDDDDANQNVYPEGLNQEIQEETNRELSINKVETEQSEPRELISEEILKESTRDVSIIKPEMQEKEPPEELIQESHHEIIRDFTDSVSEIQQDDLSEEVKQKPAGKNGINAQSKNKLHEGGNMPQAGNYEVNYKNIVIKTSDGSVIAGKTNINVFGRLTEYLKQGTDNFITVISEEAEDASKRVTAVNKNHIIWANTWD